MKELPDDNHEGQTGQLPSSSPLRCDGVEFVGAWPPLQEFDDTVSDDTASDDATPDRAEPAPTDADEIDSDAASAPQFVESSYTRVLAESCSRIVDEIVELDRADARRQAWKVELIDEARRASEATLHGVRVLGSTLSPTKLQEMARRSLVAELACALRMPESTVIGMITEAEALMHRLPATMDALRGGDISYRHARVMVDQSATLSDDAALALEEQALPHARTLTVTKFRAKTRLLRESLDPESITDRVARSAKDRRLEFQPADDGMAWLSLYTTAPEATSIYGAARDAAMAARDPRDPRTLTQLTADVFTDAVSAGLSGDVAPKVSEVMDGPGHGFGSAFRRISPTVTVTVPALTLLGVTNSPGVLEGYGPIDAESARALAGQSKTWYRMLTDPKTGAPIALDRTKYRPTKAMKRYLRYRDGSCRFPGCNRAATHCDLDHTQAAEFGGPTECDNLSHLCRKHHRLKHQSTWRVEQRGLGVLEWVSPGGKVYVTEPDVLLTPPGFGSEAQPPASPERREPPPAAPSVRRSDVPPPF